MKDHFVTYEQALALKELGFDEPCFGKYDTHIADRWVLSISPEERQFQNTNKACIAPLKSQVFKWFRDEHDLECSPCAVIQGNKKWYNISIIQISNISNLYDKYDSYEEAESVCIDKLIELIKEKKS